MTELQRLKKQTAEHYMIAEQDALAYVEQKARAGMRANPHLGEFVMGMGDWFFSHRDGEIIHDTPYCARGLNDFFERYDDVFHLTGWPMRFTADGPMITDW